MNLKLHLPVKHVSISQPFGVNFVDFYKKLGLRGHNGVDFHARRGCEIYAAHSGVINYAGDDGTGGIIVEIFDYQNLIKTIYYHLKTVLVKKGDKVSARQIIALGDNTGKMTTGDHLHFGLKQMDKNGNTINRNNGYSGAIDPGPFFFYRQNGDEIKNKDWIQPRAYHRYEMLRRPWIEEFKKSMEVWRYIRRRPSYTEANAYIYGEWSLADTANPAMYDLYCQITKKEFYKGIKPYM